MLESSATTPSRDPALTSDRGRREPLPRLREGGAALASILVLATALGGWALLAPFLDPAKTAARRDAAAAAQAVARADDGALLALALGGLCLATLVAGLETRRLDARWIALLGLLAGVGTVLRMVPGPGGFNAVFLLPILCGYAFGSVFGFLLGSLGMLVSALFTGGLGPWMPFQMLAVGWIGLGSGLLPDLGRHPKLEVAALAGWGAAAGLGFGAMVNLWFWPYLSPSETAAGWQPGAGLAHAAGRYVAFYLATSLAWDLGRAGGNLVLLALAGGPILRLLRRTGRRFRWVRSDGDAPAD